MWRCTQSPDSGCCGIAMCTACALGPPAWPRRLWTTPFPSHLDFCFCSEKNTAFILKLLSMLLPPLIGDNTDCQYCLGGKFNRYENPRLLFFLEVSEEPCYFFPIFPLMLTSGHGVEHGSNKIFSLAICNCSPTSWSRAWCRAECQQLIIIIN